MLSWQKFYMLLMPINAVYVDSSLGAMPRNAVKVVYWVLRYNSGTDTQTLRRKNGNTSPQTNTVLVLLFYYLSFYYISIKPLKQTKDKKQTIHAK